RAALDPVHDLVHPAGALAALRALAARFVAEEVGDHARHPHHARGLVHHHHAIGTSSWSAGRIGIDMPPGITPFTLRPPGTPCACSNTSSSSRVPSGSSYR